MRIKNLFTIPTGEKVTEKALRRVLISSICSILLCMTCLVSSTWAWFAVSIENEGNVIQIAEAWETVTVTDATDANKTFAPVDGVYNLKKGKYEIHVQLSSDAAEKDELNKPRTPVYVLMSVKPVDADPLYYCFAFDKKVEKAGRTLDNVVGEAKQTLEVYSESVELRFSVSWVEPSANPTDDPIVIGEKPAGMTDTPTTEPTTPEDTTPPTTEPTAPEDTTPPTTEPTAPEDTTPPTTEPTTPEDTTPPTTEPTTPESTTEPSDSPTGPSEPAATVAEEATVPDTTESTEPAAGTDETTLPAETD